MWWVMCLAFTQNLQYFVSIFYIIFFPENKDLTLLKRKGSYYPLGGVNSKIRFQNANPVMERI